MNPASFVIPEGPITVGTSEFWELYDVLCSPEGLVEFYKESSALIGKMAGVMNDAHKNHTTTYHRLNRPEKDWLYPISWIALRKAPIFGFDGNLVKEYRIGDVVTVQYAWDRDVSITHVPIVEDVMGYLRGGNWPQMVGLFLPLFSKDIVIRAVDLRADFDAVLAKSRVRKEAEDWRWPA